MSLIPFIGGSAAATPTGVQLLANDFTSEGSGTVYSGVKFDADGGVYERQPSGAWSRVYTWLLSGTNSDFYIVRTISSGTLTTDDGAGPLVLSTDRTYDIQASRDKDTFVNFEIQNVGTDVLASRSYQFTIVTGL